MPPSYTVSARKQSFFKRYTNDVSVIRQGSVRCLVNISLVFENTLSFLLFPFLWKIFFSQEKSSPPVQAEIKIGVARRNSIGIAKRIPAHGDQDRISCPIGTKKLSLIFIGTRNPARPHNSPPFRDLLVSVLQSNASTGACLWSLHTSESLPLSPLRPTRRNGTGFDNVSRWNAIS